MNAMNVKEILKLHDAKLSFRAIATKLNTSKNTVSRIIHRYEKTGLTGVPGQADMDTVMDAMPNERGNRSAQKNEPDWKEVKAKLNSRTDKYNLRYLWDEYITENPGGYSYSGYCKRYGIWEHGQFNEKNLTMLQEHPPGLQVSVDWAGKTPTIVCSSKLGCAPVRAYFFIGVLDCSYYPFVMAFPDMKQANWNLAHVKMLEHFGGVPKILQPDNCRTAVTHADLWRPQLNRAYDEFATHYNVMIMPARVRKPADKSPAEGTVNYTETWVIQKVKDTASRIGLFKDFAELNAAVQVELQKLVAKPFQKREGSRLSRFEEEKPMLNPLPNSSFDFIAWKKYKVNNSYHCLYDHTLYSVPYQYYQQEVWMWVGLSGITIYNERMIELVHYSPEESTQYVYARGYGTGKMGKTRLVTRDEHMPKGHRAIAEAWRMDGTKYRERAKKFGPNTGLVMAAVLASTKYEEQSFRTCGAILGLEKKHGSIRLEQACTVAMEYNSPNYSYVKKLLEKNLEARQPKIEEVATPIHENLRSQEEFA
jgi:transposase